MEQATASAAAESIKNLLAPFCSRIEIAGSIRRQKPFCRDIDMVLIPVNQGKLLSSLQVLGKINTGAGKMINLATPSGISVDIYVADEKTWATLLLIRTGSKRHNIKLCSLAKQKGLKLHADGSGLFRLTDAQRIAGDTEEGIFQALGLRYLPPEERE
ncbi:hypothetical protein ACFLXC_03165 [Chloroflexota bacterium]